MGFLKFYIDHFISPSERSAQQYLPTPNNSNCWTVEGSNINLFVIQRTLTHSFPPNFLVLEPLCPQTKKPLSFEVGVSMGTVTVNSNAMDGAYYNYITAHNYLATYPDRGSLAIPLFGTGNTATWHIKIREHPHNGPFGVYLYTRDNDDTHPMAAEVAAQIIQRMWRGRQVRKRLRHKELYDPIHDELIWWSYCPPDRTMPQNSLSYHGGPHYREAEQNYMTSGSTNRYTCFI